MCKIIVPQLFCFKQNCFAHIFENWTKLQKPLLTYNVDKNDFSNLNEKKIYFENLHDFIAIGTF